MCGFGKNWRLSKIDAAIPPVTSALRVDHRAVGGVLVDFQQGVDRILGGGEIDAGHRARRPDVGRVESDDSARRRKGFKGFG